MSTLPDPRAFMFAGNATFTVVSQVTGKRFTIKVQQKKDNKDTHFVSLLTGSDNERDYEFVGMIWNRRDYRHGKTSKLWANETPARAVQWVCERILQCKYLPNVTIHHEGRCGKCGRKLTVPESILSGIGPECQKAMQIS